MNNYKYFGVVKRVFISMLLIKVTFCYEPMSSEGDVEFYPEDLLNDDIPNLVNGGPYYLYSYKNMNGKDKYHIIPEEAFVLLLKEGEENEYSLWMQKHVRTNNG